MTDTTTRAQAIMRDYRLNRGYARRFEEAAEKGYLVLPLFAGFYSRLHRAWEDFCLEHDLAVILVEGTGGECTKAHVYHAPFRFYEPVAEVGVCHTVLDALTPWEETCQQAIERFGEAEPNLSCGPTSVMFENEAWTHFNDFPATTIEDLAAFLTARVREHRDQLLEEGRQT